MEPLLGQQSSFVHCTKMATLQDEISVVSQSIKIVVVSCLSGIINTLSSAVDSKNSIVKGMDALAAVCHSLIVQRSGSIRILFSQCTPRMAIDFEGHRKFAMVGTFNFLS